MAAAATQLNVRARLIVVPLPAREFKGPVAVDCRGNIA
jgi:hypothetical protein